jgi:dihydroorotate dehydrogenase
LQINIAIMYKFLSSAAFKLGAPHARKLAAYSMRLAALTSTTEPPQNLRRNLMGLSFPSPLGLAAGFDKHGKLYRSLAPLGFGFAEIGSVIPLPEQQRSLGLDVVASVLSKYIRPHAIPLGVSISMNRATPPEQMANDYLVCMEKLWEFADYITLNLGVRAGPDLHLTEHRATLYTILTAVKDKQVQMVAKSGRVCPIVVKIDRDRGDTNNLLSCVRDCAFNGLILSGGVHLNDKKITLANLQRASSKMSSNVPIISVGGIHTPQDVADRLSAGASLVQLYSGLVESGPLLPKRINTYLSNLVYD